MTVVVQRRAPDLEWVPAEVVGQPVVGVVVCWSGATADGERTVEPLRHVGRPLVDGCTVKPFLEHQRSFDPSFEPGRWYYVRSCDVDGLSDGVIDVMAEFGQSIRSPISSIALWQMGGAVARVGEEESAFNGRGAGFTFNINGNAVTSEGFEAERAWAGGGRGPRPGCLRRREVRAAHGAEVGLRPGQLLPAQPEHPADRQTGRRGRRGRQLTATPGMPCQ